MSSNKLLVCPYDEAHKVKSTRMQLHITRCRMNHLNETKFTCPFNATHVMPYQERDYHLLHCADKGPLDRMVSESLDKNNPFRGRIAVPSYSDTISFKMGEDWEAAVDNDPTPGYLPTTKERPPCAVVEPAPFLGASVKKQLYQELHHQPEDIDFKSYLNTGSSIPAPIPRQPKQPSEASKYQLGGEDFPILGLGRGRTLGSRIAANFYSLPAKNKNAVPAKTYSSVVSNRINIAPFQMNDTQVNTNSLTGEPDIADEFLALGFGRGRMRYFLPQDS